MSSRGGQINSGGGGRSARRRSTLFPGRCAACIVVWSRRCAARAWHAGGTHPGSWVSQLHACVAPAGAGCVWSGRSLAGCLLPLLPHLCCCETCLCRLIREFEREARTDGMPSNELNFRKKQYVQVRTSYRPWLAANGCFAPSLPSTCCWSRCKQQSTTVGAAPRCQRLYAGAQRIHRPEEGIHWQHGAASRAA